MSDYLEVKLSNHFDIIKSNFTLSNKFKQILA